MPNFLKSFVPIDKHNHFPIQNLPYGVFQTSRFSTPQVGVAIGDQILNLTVLETRDFFPFLPKHTFDTGCLNKLMSLGEVAWKTLRLKLMEILSDEISLLRDDKLLRAEVFVAQSDAHMLLPVKIGDYTDFYASKEHASNVGAMFRDKNNSLLPNWKHLPVGYHGRASSVVVSGTDIRRPKGQIKSGEAPPVLSPTKKLDFELELACFVGGDSFLGEPISIAEARKHIFGFVLLNDWSARDIQKWEYVPLGPFVSKSFATSISPWVVTAEALAPFLTEGPEQDVPLLPYLKQPTDGHFDIELQVTLKANEQNKPKEICRTNSKFLYWSFDQKIAHHTISGCNLKTGDLLASGTISGPTADSLGSLLEITWDGSNPIEVGRGSLRTFLEDGDEITMSGFCQKEGYVSIGFGSVAGQIIPAQS